MGGGTKSNLNLYYSFSELRLDIKNIY